MTFVRVHIKPDSQKVWESDMHYSEDGMMRDHDLGRHVTKVTGSVVTLSIINVQKTIDDVEATYRQVFNASEEIKFKHDDLGMPRMEMPTSVPARIGYGGEGGLVYKTIPQIHEEKVLFYHVSISKDVVHIDCHSTSSEVEIGVDHRFPKYFSREKYVSFKSFEYTGEFDEIVRQLYCEHQRIPYVPSVLRTGDDVVSALATPVESGFTLGDLSMFAPKKQRK